MTYRTAKTVTFEWSGITDVSLELLCFGGVVAVTQDKCQRHRFRCSRTTVVPVYRVLHQLSTNRDSGVKAAPELLRSMERHPTVSVTSDGLLVKKRVGCCKATMQFLPWDTLKTCSLSRDKCCVTVGIMRGNESAQPTGAV